MALEWTIVEQGRGIVYTAAGDLTAQEVIASKRELLADPDTVRRLVFGIFTFEEVLTLTATTEEIRELAAIDEQVSALIPDVVVGIVAPRDHEFGTARMWEAFAIGTGWETYVFRTHAEADAWIRSTLAGREAVNASIRQIEDILQARLAGVHEEILRYPVPIAGCDDQFNRLLEHRAGIPAELARFRDALNDGTPATDRQRALDAFISSCPYLDSADLEGVRSGDAGRS